jgi:H+/Cl- antiporter ClcA
MMISIAAMRKHLALPKTSWQICLLAILGGCASALLVVLFTLTIEEIQQFYLSKRQHYNSLNALSRFDLPIAGAIVILIIAWLTGYKYLRTGIPFVLHRLKVAHGVIPFKNTLNQFWGSAVALASGFSVGKEGPAVHLGAACSSYLGSVLKLPYNSVRTLCACGIAAGIAATFNTPIAAVIFVMEVIMREYKVHIFVPVMLASIVGSLVTQNFFWNRTKFSLFSNYCIAAATLLFTDFISDCTRYVSGSF